MSLVFQALGMSAADYDWYISDIEMNCDVEEFSAEDRWMSGDELHQCIEQHEIQFIWAVFSAVPKGYRRIVECAPYADDNPRYWTGDEPVPQLPGALFEVACWDSSAVILVGLPEDAKAKFKRAYPDARSLIDAARQSNG